MIITSVRQKSIAGDKKVTKSKAYHRLANDIAKPFDVYALHYDKR